MTPEERAELSNLRRGRDLADRNDAEPVEVLREPADQPWGVRDRAFRNPSGNLVRLSQA